MNNKKIEKFNSHDPRNFKKINAWVFDLDNTLYQVTQKLLKNIDEHMGAFVANYLNTSREEAHRIQKTYFRKYGLTLRGLMIHHGLDPEQYFEEMKPMDLNEIPPNPILGKAISHLAGRKFIYTNASEKHSRLVLERLGMENVFEGIFDIQAANYIPKPAIESYKLLCKRHNFDSQCAVIVIPASCVPSAAGHSRPIPCWAPPSSSRRVCRVSDRRAPPSRFPDRTSSNRSRCPVGRARL